MKKHISKILLCFIALSLPLSGCQVSAPSKQSSESKEEIWIENPLPKEEEDIIEGKKQMSSAERELYINAIEPCEPLNLTREQKLEDYDLFWNTIREKVYCLDEILAEVGVETDKYIAEFRNKVAESKNDFEFWKAFHDSVQMCAGHWHIELNSPYWSMTTGITLSDESNIFKKTVGDENDRKLKYWDVLLTQSYNQYRGGRAQGVTNEPMPSLRIVDDQTAVIEVPTFNYSSQREKAGERLIEYMKQVSDYENVIFDLKGNRGGNERIGYHNLIAPNIEKPMTTTRIKYFKMQEDISNYIIHQEGGPWKSREGYIEMTSYTSMPISQLPDKFLVQNGEYGNADYYLRDDWTILPRFDHKVLKGRIWILTYPENYSSAEGFISVCKDTGFATTVGKQTKGNGGGSTMPISLPNSGLSGRVTFAWRLNDDGTNNNEQGIKPDIESQEGETPLETCLRVIEEVKQ